MTYSIEKVTTLIGARRYGNSEATVGWLLTDSRSLCFPEQTLFFALRTKRGDGHRYIDELYSRGVRSFVVEQVPDHPQPDANYLKVSSTLAALQRLAERHRDEFQIPIVGITGSNGKTWVKEWLYQLLLPSQKIVRSPRSYNSQIGVPLSVWLLNEQTEIGIFEAGISQPGEMMALHDIIQPTIGVLTCLGNAHQENFRSMEEKCMEKLELMHDAETIIYPSDDNTVSRCIRRSGYRGNRIGWSHTDERAEMYIKEWRAESGTTSEVTYIYKGTRGSYSIPFIDEASIENSITCATIALHLGVTPEQLAERMPLLEPIAMRLEVKRGQRGCTLINDSYNNDINSLNIALDFLKRRVEDDSPQNSHPTQQTKKTLILSDIYQSGESTTELYQQVAALCQQRGIDKFIGIGPDISAQANAFAMGEKHFFATTEEFLQSTVFHTLHDEAILLKGARHFGFEHITEQLEQKVHETILEVNLQAVVDNLNHFRSFLRPETKMVCMIKADAYGAGAVEIARTLQEHRVDYLAVAVADEGVTLRKAGITANIMVMNPEMTSFKTLFDYDLEPEVYSFRLLDALIKAARKEGITGWPVHIKLDTGMHRLGFNTTDEIPELIDRLRHQQAIIPRSVFSHFVGSDSDEFDDFSEQQFRLFDEGSRQLQAAFHHKILRHIDNSAGIEHFPERQLDMCRLGIGLYGVEPYQIKNKNNDEMRYEKLEIRNENDDNEEMRYEKLEMRNENDEMRNAMQAHSSQPISHSSFPISHSSQPISHSSFPISHSSLSISHSLAPVSTLKTTVLQLRHVKAGDSIGYSRRTILERDSIIGAIPIGYADGLNRHMGNRHGYCIVNGQRADYVGNICMDVAMIDVTDIPCQEGDMVEIFGPNLPVTIISDITDTIPYEVLTGVSNRVKRIYYQD